MIFISLLEFNLELAFVVDLVLSCIISITSVLCGQIVSSIPKIYGITSVKSFVFPYCLKP